MSKKVIVVGFISHPDVKDKDKYEVSQNWKDTYLNPEEDIAIGQVPMGQVPLVLREEMIANAWEDEDGHLGWDEDFQPKPVKGDDGNVYLNLNDSTMSKPIEGLDGLNIGGMLLMDAQLMLSEEETE